MALHAGFVAVAATIQDLETLLVKVGFEEVRISPIEFSRDATYPPEAADAELKTKGAGWHQHGGRPVQELERPSPRLSLEITYCLSDTTIPGDRPVRRAGYCC